jgi:hypothetical protein
MCDQDLPGSAVRTQIPEPIPRPGARFPRSGARTPEVGRSRGVGIPTWDPGIPDSAESGKKCSGRQIVADPGFPEKPKKPKKTQKKRLFSGSLKKGPIPERADLDFFVFFPGCFSGGNYEKTSFFLGSHLISL